jgi:pimeloyl-ACP methyl ester carboxylesterase
MPTLTVSHMTSVAGLDKVRTDDGISIAYQAIGKGPRTLLALHGWGGAGTGHSWREMIPHLDLANLRMVAIDLRGHGESDQPDFGFTLDRFERDILAVADHVGAERFVMIAFSMSGRWAQWISSRLPARVLGQVLVAPVPASALPLGEELLESWMHTSADRERFEPWIRQFTGEPLPEGIIDGYFNDVSRASDVAKRETFRMCCRDDFSQDVGSTTVPTLVAAGNQDPMLSPEFLRQEIVARIAGSRLVRADCGHEIPIERPAQAAALIEAFLAGLRE